MRFEYRLLEGLPPLAWVAFVRAGAGSVEVLHGRFVETHERFFVEGAWAGEFAAGELHRTDTVFGSGAAIADGAVTFVSCTATTDFLHHGERGGVIVVANSLPLLLAALDDRLDPACEDYGRINLSVLSGIRHYRAEIPSLNGGVRRLVHANLRIARDGTERVDKPLPPPFPTFESYRDFLRERLQALFANARDATRRMPMRIFSTQSKGYDTTAVNALCAPLGVDRVFTSTRAKEERSFHFGRETATASDDGTPICTVLGLDSTPIDRLSFRAGLAGEHYYWAGFDNNADLNLHAIHQFIEGPTLLLTGTLGEIWYPSSALDRLGRSGFENDELRKWDQGGMGLGEVRLVSGLVQAAIPFVGARRFPEILRISDGSAMDRFRLGVTYDRPIPRRIAEEAGVPRELFGQTKLASVVHLPTPNVPVTAALRHQYFAHLRRSRLLGRLGIALLPLVQRLNNRIYWTDFGRYLYDRRRHPLLWRAAYYFSRLVGKPPLPRLVWTRLDSFLYAFCVNKVRDEYAAHLAAAAHTSAVAGGAVPAPAAEPADGAATHAAGQSREAEGRAAPQTVPRASK